MRGRRLFGGGGRWWGEEGGEAWGGFGFGGAVRVGEGDTGFDALVVLDEPWDALGGAHEAEDGGEDIGGQAGGGDDDGVAGAFHAEAGGWVDDVAEAAAVDFCELVEVAGGGDAGGFDGGDWGG